MLLGAATTVAVLNLIAASAAILADDGAASGTKTAAIAIAAVLVGLAVLAVRTCRRSPNLSSAAALAALGGAVVSAFSVGPLVLPAVLVACAAAATGQYASARDASVARRP